MNTKGPQQYDFKVIKMISKINTPVAMVSDHCCAQAGTNAQLVGVCDGRLE